VIRVSPEVKVRKMTSSSNLVFHVFAGLAVLLLVSQILTSKHAQGWLRQLLVGPMQSSPSLEPRYVAAT